MSAPTTPAVTAGLRPELFAAGPLTRTGCIVALAVLVVTGFALRATGLSAEGLSEDEFNKLAAVEDYRAHGLTPANGEHPFLMKALQTASVVAAEHWNNTSLVAAHQATLYVPVETALRLPSAIFGALTIIVLYLLVAELFGGEVALIAAALWAFDPSAIGFNRIAKEDTFMVFFFLLANVFWLRSQRRAETGQSNPVPYYWATAITFGAMFASKYLPGYFAASIAYYHIFQALPATRWRLGKPRFLLFFFILGTTFVLLNLPILLPGTWRMALSFASYKRIGHDSYEFMGQLYRHKLSDWLRGVPVYYYFVLIAVKLPPLTLLTFITGLPLLFRRRFGDGRYFLLFWVAIGFLPFVFVGGKFMRYFTPVLPVVLITAAIGMQFIGQQLARAFSSTAPRALLRTYAPTLLSALIALASLWSAAYAAPHYRLYTNLIGGGQARAGYYFPQDEFYDAGLRAAVAEIAQRARPKARVANETPALTTFYAQQAQRPDLISLSLSDVTERSQLSTGDYVLVERGRRYLSNDAVISALRQTTAPAFRISIGATPAVEVYALDEKALAALRAAEHK